MGGRRRLVGGFRAWLPDHRRHDGRTFRRFLDSAQEIVGSPTSERLRVEVERYAVAGVAYEQAAREWAAVVDRRERGRGRRPAARAVERAARRLGLADQTLKDATARLEEVAAAAARGRNGHGADPLADVMRELGGRGLFP